MDINKKSLEKHEEHNGKLGIYSKFKLDSKEDLSIAYTPGVAEVSRKVFENSDNAYKYTIKKNSVAVISDGSAVLGLGNIGGLASLPVMEGKAILFKEFADIDAYPIVLENQDVDKTVETIKNIYQGFGGINLEDFKAPECFEIEKRLQDLNIPVMHDDQHGAAVVVLAGLLNALKLRESKDNIEDINKHVKIIINGSGAAGVAITKMLSNFGFDNIIVVDSKGVIFKGRNDLNDAKKEIVKITNLACSKGLSKDACITGGLSAALNRADIFIGVSKPGILTKEMIKTMNNRPVIFALSNPIPEIMPDEAKKAEVFIIATGRSDFPNQVNNVLAFPGIFRGALDVRATKITEKMKIAAAISLAGSVKDLSVEKILPSPLDKNVTKIIAKAVSEAWSNN